MLFRIVTLAVWAAVAGVGAVSAQTIGDISGPKEQPPASYKGGQYVDSRGCVFLRAGYGGQTSWVPRVDRSRKVLCGYPPTLAAQGQRAPVAVAEAPAPRAPSAGAGRPIDTVASLNTTPSIKEKAPKSSLSARDYAAPPVANMPAPRIYAPAAPKVAANVAAPRAVAVAPVPVAAPAPVARQAQGGCPPNAPFAERVMLTDGRAATLCTSRVGLIAAPVAPTVVASAPQYQPQGRVVAQPALAHAPRVAAGKIACRASTPDARRFRTTDGGSVVMCTSGGQLAGATVPVRVGIEAPIVLADGADVNPVIPKGYKPAWEDDRLNPYRGQETRAGRAAQDQIWTRDHPAKLISDVPVKKRKVIIAKDGTRYIVSSKTPAKTPASQKVIVSTKSDPKARVAPQAQGWAYVQVGTFGVAPNAESAKARLAGLGLPVRGSTFTKSGKALQIVLAGPFADQSAAQAALAAARRAGFADAFIR